MNKHNTTWVAFGGGVGFRLIATAAFSPIDYAKTLIQIGFEPIPPKPTKTLLGKDALGLPNVFTYVKYIHSIDGTVGCFRGLTPRLCSTFLTTVSHSYVIDRFKIPEDGVNDENLTDTERQELHIKKLSRDILATSAAIIVSQPFHVIAIRMMAQFVGRETQYSGMFSSIQAIYQEGGLLGLFSGLIPRLLGEITTVFLVSNINFAINTYLVPDDQSVQSMFSIGVDFLVKNLTYPFQVVAVCMAVNTPGLKAGSPPIMPLYSGNWIKCWRDLSDDNQLKRGSGLVWRYHNPPNKKYDTSSNFAPLPEILRY